MSESPPENIHDDICRRCPRLGSQVNFGYCRCCEKEHQPCVKVFDCWWEQFDVVSYFRNHLTPQRFRRLSQAPAPNKIASLVEIIQQAQKRAQKG